MKKKIEFLKFIEKIKFLKIKSKQLVEVVKKSEMLLKKLSKPCKHVNIRTH